MCYKHPAWWFPSISLHSCVTRKRKKYHCLCTFFMSFWIMLSSVSAAQEHSQSCPSLAVRWGTGCPAALCRQTTRVGSMLKCSSWAELRGTSSQASHIFLWSWTPAAFLTLCDPATKPQRWGKSLIQGEAKPPATALWKVSVLCKSITVLNNVMVLFCYLSHEGHKLVPITRPQTSHSTHPFSSSSALLG